MRTLNQIRRYDISQIMCSRAAIRHVADLWNQRPKAADEDEILERRITRGMVKGPACREALQLPEVLEQVISHLPGRTIFTHAQRVSKFWKNVIGTSPLVQKKLWLRSLSAHISSPTGISTEQDILRTRPKFANEALSSGVPIYPGSFHINTLFPRLYSRQALLDNRSLPRHYVNIVELPRGKLVDIGIPRDKVSAKESERPTWLNLPLTEPPITTAWVAVVIHDYLYTLRLSAYWVDLIPVTVRNDGGLTFASVIDVVDRMMAQPAWEELTKSISVRICFVADEVEVVRPIQELRGDSLRRGAMAF
jgi:hypothetical protein